jgi:hypothetical protein
MTAPRWKGPPDVVSVGGVAEMAQVTANRAGQIIHPGLHAGAPPSTMTAAGQVWDRGQVAAYLELSSAERNTSRTWGKPPDVVSLRGAAEIYQVSPQTAAARLDPQLHPDAPPSCQTPAGAMWVRADIMKHAKTFA